MARATQRVVRTFVAWGVLVETSDRGIFVPATRIEVADSAVGPWLLDLDDVTRFLTDWGGGRWLDAGLLGRRLCVHPEIDPRPAGLFALNVTGHHVTRGTFREMEPGRRLVYTWLFDHVRSRRAAVARYGGGQLTPVGRGMRVRLRHSVS